jgi:hypothetical protein
MGILDELESKRTSSELLDDWLANRTEEERTEWLIAFADDARYSCGALSRLLNAKGFRANDNMVARYRRRLKNAAR